MRGLSALSFRPLSPVIGLEVSGVDPAAPIDSATFAELERQWLDHNVLLFRGVRMTPAQHVAFTRRFGALHVMAPPQYNHPEYPEIFVVSNVEVEGRAVGMRRVGLGWHTDGEDKAIPNAGSLLYAREVPPEGGDTWFANMYAAHDVLPADLRRRIEGRRACYSRVRLHEVHYPHLPPLTDAQKAERPDVWHPLIRTHPRTGRKALYIGRWACEVEDLPEDEGREIIAKLQAFAAEPRFVYRHQWRVHDALLWDNRSTLHCATTFDETRYHRLMHRTTLEGDAPF
jgi:alpha-ketoglutarate-dependent taurine dioxygenase